MDEAYLEVYSLAELCLAPIETIVTLFTVKYCNSKINIKLILSKKKPLERAYAIDISNFVYEVMDAHKIPYHASSCELPIIIVNKTSCVAGLCAILRQIVKEVTAEHPKHSCRKLLGFKESCLTACSETSVWTKFCEVDLILTVKFLHADSEIKSELPISMARFERHMSQPVRLHNLYKYTMSKKYSDKSLISPEGLRLLEHTEGSHITLADIIIFVCTHILLTVFSSETTMNLLPLTAKWYKKMIEDQIIVECLKLLPLLKSQSITEFHYTLPQVANQSLYKSDPKRYKPRSRIYTRQEDIEDSLELFKALNIQTNLDLEPFGAELNLDWSSIPYDATPEGGSLPLTRLKKKQEQLENMCKPVMKLAKAGNIIVDFCSGSGHLGILVAYLLPYCTVILLENKEQSLNRAKERVKKLGLTNVKIYQCNLDYFKGHFDIGMSLHACGVATDLVIQQCIRLKAIFVCCPCCYGSLHDCHHLTYPRSNVFKKQMESEKYIVLSHAADQTHDEQNVKTKQGYECMAIIDTDRKLEAEQFGYKVYLSKFIPNTCTPKNHIIVGIPRKETVCTEYVS
ncbi:glutathione S-transferase C-terminal domain-containing protein homolog isoform X1 [Osmia bicornis bicornis]|uniref:glutathione S-transferase C-terminal domain-containing protein homolog isoform X1 n=1 Tax=Osmia bicornis bicornis TaxID=1437191 RepID=UPI0010F863AC|nr:glutathione S-transferase C-terminal domain-containing protein homolog isoform X1 [Osmia bicornis bicornis]XP_029054812.1 glutathione S-transferase C-terminal domain-containing protein homolog isoform X1 [Osmia bicornis bicornis]